MNIRQMLFVATVFGSTTTVLADDPVVLRVPGDYLTIQSAIDVANHGEVIEVSEGVYLESIDLKGKRIQLLGAGSDVTLITSNYAPNTSVVTCKWGETSETVIEGFTIAGGTGTPRLDWTAGGGFYLFGSHPTIRDCVIMGNNAGGGGGLFCLGASPSVVNCTIMSNSAWFSGSPGGGGGGVQGVNGSPRFFNCKFVGNSGEENVVGGAMAFEGGQPLLVNCVITDNESYMGGAIHNLSSRITMTNCTVIGNSAAYNGGAIKSRNTAAISTIRNSIIRDNVDSAGAPLVAIIGAELDIQFSNIEGGWGDEPDSNIDEDPGFTGFEEHPFELSSMSPCIDRGTAEALSYDYADLDNDDDVFELIPVDMDMKSRQQGANVDIGAYEFQQPLPVCPEDLTGDGLINLLDLLQLIENWGGDGPGAAIEPNESVVDLYDLLTLLSGWGVCPE